MRSFSLHVPSCLCVCTGTHSRDTQTWDAVHLKLKLALHMKPKFLPAPNISYFLAKVLAMGSVWNAFLSVGSPRSSNA